MNISHKLVEAFTQAFSNGNTFQTIYQARQLAQSILGKSVIPGTPAAKLVDESIERGLVRVASQLVSVGNTPLQVYESLVDLYQHQPILGTRSSTSVAQQAYSTPLPIAYVASKLARITPTSTVYEPTAGHGALLVGSNPTNVIANEINSERADELVQQGYSVTQHDATTYLPKQKVDVVILNPPFGSVRVEGESKVFAVPEAGVGVTRAFATTQIEYAIALQALRAMKAEGTAVLLLSGKMGNEQERSNRYNSKLSRAFYYALYQQYNVTQHLSIRGELYARQGAGFPIDLIVIEGQGKSKRPLPAALVPRVYYSFEELKELVPNAPVHEYNPSLDEKVTRERSANDRSVERRVSTTTPEPDPLLLQLSGTVSATDRVDDQARTESGSSARTNQSPYRDGWDVSITDPTTASRRFSLAVGNRIDSGQRLSSRQTQLDAGNQVSNPSQREPASNRDNQADQPRDVVANHVGTSKVEKNSIHYPSYHSQEQEVQSMADQSIEQPKQVPYQPISVASKGNTLVPVNMQAGIVNALQRLESQVGSLDEYVADKLNYGSPTQLHQYFNAEQVDALALAISNLEKKRGFIIGDQTGVGKGRVVAAVLRYAKQTGRIPIFVTKDPTLYADMMRDLSDIDMADFHPFVTNTDANVPLPDGRKLGTSYSTHKQEMQSFASSGKIGDYDAVFTTYSQMQTVRRNETDRRNFLRAVAPNSIFVLDESHEAGGTKEKQLTSVPDRAQFTRQLLAASQGGVYSSATFAKRPDVMDLYFLTDMGQAVSTEKLVGLVERGGIPMQQGLATMLTKAGQYVRRERSYEGVSFDAKVSPVNKDVVESIAAIQSAILDFDRIKQAAVKELDKELKAEAKAVGFDNSTGIAGADSTNFTSIMHNLVEQSLLALKAEATVQECLSSLRNHQKPVIALANTMGSFIGEYAKANNLSPGTTIDLSFTDLLKRYLERTRDILVQLPGGEKTRHRLTDDQLGLEGVAQYEAALELIQETDLGDMPISPIDYIEHRLQQENYRISEITGRTEIVEYDSEGNTFYAQRDSSKATARTSIDAFNAGRIDVLILNRSGSTGISLHASERFADQKQRHMIVVQPEKDINQFMQMLGRVHRTGQVALPQFTLLMADIPAEKRPNAVLLKKMASLNANTSAARKSGISFDNVPDFMNDYGDQIVADMILNDPQLNHKLDYPIKGIGGIGEEISTEKAVTRVTGRITLLPLTEQEAFYDHLEREYAELVERSEAIGESILEANTLDLNARTIAQMEVLAPDEHSQSPFSSGVYLEVVDAKTPRKPLTSLEVANVCRKNLGLEALGEVTDYEFEKIRSDAVATSAVEIASLKQRIDEYKKIVTSRMSSSATEKLSEKLDKQSNHVRNTLQEFPIGKRVRVVTAKQNVFYGVVARTWETSSRASNPVAPANWKMQLLLADSVRELTVPLSQVNTYKSNSIDVLPSTQDLLSGEDVYDLFDLRQTQLRQERQIFTGNLLRAYEAFEGKLVNFSDSRGKIRQGVLTPQGFDIEKSVESKPVRMPTRFDAKQFITEETQRTGVLKTLDELLTIKAERRGNGFTLQTPLPRNTGGQYYLDPDILTATGVDFCSVGDRMECIVSPQRIDAVLEVITNKKGLSLAAFDQRTKAREMLEIKLPKLKQLNQSLPNQTELSSLNTVSPLEKDLTSHQIQEPLVTNELTSFLPEAQKASSPVGIGETQTHEATSNEGQSVASVLAEPCFQNGLTEKNVAKLLHEAGLASEILSGEDFHLKVKNEPFTPLSIERLGNELYLTHYLADYYGDLYIDSEMVFDVSSSGQLSLTQTAVQNPLTGGEYRHNDKKFGNLFSKNLLDQGFTLAAERAFAAKMHQTNSPATLLPESAPILSEQQKEQDSSNRASTTLTSDATVPASRKPPKELEESAQTLAAAVKGEVVEVANGYQQHSAASLNQPTQPAVTTNPIEVVGSTQPEAIQVDLFEFGLNMSRDLRVEPLPQIPSPEQLPSTEATIPVASETTAKESNVESSISTSKEDTLPSQQQPTDSTQAQKQRSPSYRQLNTRFETENLSELANSVRNFDLETVAEELGLERDRLDKHKWRGNGQIISINGQRFYDHLNSSGSGGAIDLVMHVNDCPYRSAVDWLADRSATPRPGKASSFKIVEKEVVKEESNLALPLKDETKWSLVRSYLIKNRGLPEALVDALHSKDLIYADTMSNAVFLRHATTDWQRQEQTGANLRGTLGKFHRLSPGTERDKGWFFFNLGKGDITRVVLSESAIDAISLAALDKIKGRPEGVTVYLSVDGAGATPTSDIQLLLSRGGKVELAFDADTAGDQMAAKLLAQIPGAVRVRPEFGKDWNDQLLHIKSTRAVNHSDSSLPANTPSTNLASSPIHVFQQQVDKVDKRTGDFLAMAQASTSSPSLETLRNWYRAARELGKTQKYLERIKTVANEFKTGKQLTDKALNSMQHDFDTQKQVLKVLSSSDRVLQAWGQQSQPETQHFQGKKYELNKLADNLTISTSERGMIFSYQQGRIELNQLNESDIKAFEAVERRLERNYSLDQDLENER